jgi:phage terminase large subunit-like protein
MKEAAWTEALRPALADKKGKALFLSTPKGRNWFWQIWNKGNDPLETEWQSFKFKTVDNPHIDPAEVEAARGLPERVFLQEFEAEFVEDAGAVFRNVMNCIHDGEPYEQQPHNPIVFGVDWGKHLDFTVVSVIDTIKNRQIYQDRFNQIDYIVQTQRLKILAQQYKPISIVVERNSMGEPLIEQLQRDGLPIQPFTTTNASKAQAIEALALAFERGEIEILNDPVLIGELQAYEMERLPSGMLRYNAPEGMHDDTVMALAMAWTQAGVGPLGDDAVSISYSSMRQGW